MTSEILSSERIQEIYALGCIGVMSDYVNEAEILKTVYLCDGTSKCSDYCPHNVCIIIVTESKVKHELNNKAFHSCKLSSCFSWRKSAALTNTEMPSFKEINQPLSASWSLWTHSILTKAILRPYWEQEYVFQKWVCLHFLQCHSQQHYWRPENLSDY